MIGRRVAHRAESANVTGGPQQGIAPGVPTTSDFTQRSHLGNGAEIAIGQYVGAPSHFSKDHRGLPS